MDDDKYTQICVWEACELGLTSKKEFISGMNKDFNVRAKLLEEVKTIPDKNSDGKDIPKTGGRIDLFFSVHVDDIGKFAIMRLSAGIRWWEDVLGNPSNAIYSQEIKDKYPPTWNKEIIAQQEQELKFITENDT